MFSTQTEQNVLRHFHESVNQTIERVLKSVEKDRKKGHSNQSPFASIMLPDFKIGNLRPAMVERAYSTSMGHCYNHIAKEIASEVHEEAAVQVIVSGEITSSAASGIDNKMENYTGKKKKPPNRAEDFKFIEEAAKDLSAGMVWRSTKSDLYIKTKDGKSYYQEIKTPMPNYPALKQMKRTMFNIHALQPNAIPMVVFPFDPSGVDAEYNWAPCRYWLDPLDWQMDGKQMIGKDFWAFVGQKEGTFDWLLQCCEEVYKERSDDLKSLLKI